jgi:hypothetical protein
LDIEEIIDKVLPCIEKHAEGRNETTRERRRAILAFFDYCAVYAADELPEPMVLAYDLQHHLNLLTDGMDRISTEMSTNDASRQSIYAELDAAWRILADAFVGISAAIEAGDLKSVAGAAADPLRELFDWGEPGRLRAYVYARTGELLERGLLDKERSLLLHAVRKCVQEIDE